MAYQNVLEFDSERQEFKKIESKKEKRASAPKKKKDDDRGCDFCPLNKIKGLHKVKNLDKIQGKTLMVWAQSPGYNENKEGRELVGDAGKFLWEHAASVGLKRADCDIQNVVRCWPVDVDEDTEQWTPRHTPNKQELHCCSLYTEQALEKVQGKTKVHLVFGQVAAKALLKGEYRKDQKTFWSEKLKAWVILTYHPSYFLRGAPRSKIDEFREAIAIAVQKAKSGVGRFAYIRNQDYRSVRGHDVEKEILEPVLEASSKGIVITVDIEDGLDENGENVITYVGFSWAKGMSRGMWLAHKDLRLGTKWRNKKLEVLKRILEDPEIKKALHYGCYDVWKLFKKLGIRLKGFVHDTIFSEYLRFPGRKAYGLEAIADIRFREFAGYKGILDEHRDKETGLVNFYTIPMRTEEIYNGADCDLTKRIQLSNRKKVKEPLLRLFMHVAPVLARMEERGPWVDFKHGEILDRWIPIRLATVLKQIQEIANDKHFNPNKPQSVAEVVYDKLKLGRHLDEKWRAEYGRTTNADTMLILSSFHKFPKLILEFRQLAKKKSTYMDGFRNSALMHGGRVRTMWKLTGTVTGRLRSGGEKSGKKKSKGLVNLQNIHGAKEIECLLVSDLKWRDLYNAWRVK